MTINRPHPALVFFLLDAAIVALFIIASCGGDIPQSNDTRPIVQNIIADLTAQKSQLEAQNILLKQQLATVRAASDAATATGDFIDQSISWGTKALNAASSLPTAVAALQAQSKTLNGAKSSNETTAAQLRTAQENNTKLIDSNAALASSNTILSVKASTAMAQTTASEKEKDALRKSVADYKASEQEHHNDFFGPKVHRFFHTIGIVTLIIFGGGLIAIGVLGCLYGLPSITKPAAGILGGILNGLRVGAYYVGTFVLSCLGPVGHWLDEHFFYHNQLKAQVAAIQHPTPNLASPANDPSSVTTIKSS